MDSVGVYFPPLSPGSVLVAVVTVIFLLNQAWQLLCSQKKEDAQHESTPAPARQEEISSSLAVFKEPEVPAGWWSGREAFELERRAIFSKTWQYLAHSTQLPKPGAYQSFNLAGFPIFVIRGKDDRIRAFHNVCRHRAYTVTRKESGASTVLGCRYHGWSYDTTGRLVKAPQFDHLPAFDKSQNSLFEIHALTTAEGFVFVNLDAGEAAVFDQLSTSGLDRFAKTAGKPSSWLAGQTLSGDFNWKMGLSARYRKSLVRRLEQRAAEVLASSLVRQVARALTGQNSRAECAIFPATFLYSFEHARHWMSATFFPSSETSTMVRYDLFSSSTRTDSDGNALSQILEEAMREMINEIETEYRRFTEKPGSSTPDTDWSSTGPLHRILDQMQAHAKLEKTRGAQVLPAMRQPKASSQFERAEQLCRELDCLGGGAQNGTALSAEGLVW